MTVDTHPDAPEPAVRDAECLHEYAVNELGHRTYDVLFTANSDGSIDGTIEEDVAMNDNQ
jgi:hypothetical protein